MRIAIGADHNGFHLKEVVKKHLKDLGHDMHDLGCHSEEEVDYPDIAIQVANAVAAGRAQRAFD